MLIIYSIYCSYYIGVQFILNINKIDGLLNRGTRWMLLLDILYYIINNIIEYDFAL